MGEETTRVKLFAFMRIRIYCPRVAPRFPAAPQFANLEPADADTAAPAADADNQDVALESLHSSRQAGAG